MTSRATDVNVSRQQDSVDTGRGQQGGDYELLVRARAGDQAAWNALTLKYQRAVLYAARQMSPTQTEAEEFAQEFWAKIIVLVADPAKDLPCEFIAFATTMMRNQLRSKRRREQRFLHVGLEEAPPAADAADESRRDFKHLWPLIRAVLLEKSEQDREILAGWLEGSNDTENDRMQGASYSGLARYRLKKIIESLQRAIHKPPHAKPRP